MSQINPEKEVWRTILQHLEIANNLQRGLKRRHLWDSYVDQYDCEAALLDLIDSAKSEIEAIEREEK